MHRKTLELQLLANADVKSTERLEQESKLKKDIENLYNIKHERSRIRAKVPKTDNENPFKSFFNIEINRAYQSCVTQIKNDNGPITKDKTEISDQK